MRTISILVLLFCATSATAQTQLRWVQSGSQLLPLPRKMHAMAYDAARAETILFGGFNGAPMNDTWAYDAAGWRPLNPATVPAARFDHTMAYDPVRKRIVMVAGQDAVGVNHEDTWEWDGSDWSLVASSISGMTSGILNYDPRLGGVLYSGLPGNMVWDGTSWTMLTLANPATFDATTSMVYDAASGGIIGLWNEQNMRFRPHVGWEHISFSRIVRLSRNVTAIDPSNSTVIIFGGKGRAGNSTGGPFAQTWEWRNGEWALVNDNTGPRGVQDAEMVFDLARGVFVLFGGEFSSDQYTQETWELVRDTQQASFDIFGQGCSALGANPSLRADPFFSPAPYLGGDFVLRLDDLPPSQPVMGIFGFSDQMVGNLPLPLSGNPFGMPGCSLYVSIDIVGTIGTSNAGGVALWTVHVPDQLSLLGLRFFQQIAVSAPGANALDLLWSNAGAGIVGLRPSTASRKD